MRVRDERTDRYGRDGEVMKPTMLMTNSPEIARMMAARCANHRKGDVSEGEQKKAHEHVLLVGGRAKQAQVYPKKFSQRMCEGIAAQKRADELGVVGIPLMNLEELSEVAQSHNSDGEGPMDALHERAPEENVECYDDVSGEELDIKGVRKARKEKIAYLRSMKVYEKVPIAEVYEKTGKAPIFTRWIDINKGDKKKPLYRSRLVAKSSTRARGQISSLRPRPQSV